MARAAERQHGAYPAGLVLLRALADHQERMTRRLHGEVAKARAAGYSWSDIGRALGINRETIFRQYHASDRIVVVRPHQTRQGAPS